MLDAIEPRDDLFDALRACRPDAGFVPISDLLVALRARRPDAGCLAEGDEHVSLARCCYAAGRLSDPQIARRVVALVGATDRYTAAVAVARHCATMEMPLHQIIAVLAYLAAEVPCWPDSDENAAIAQAAVAEFA